MLTNILVPLDGSPEAETALPYARVIASRTGAQLTLVRAARNPFVLGDVTYDSQQRTIETAERYLAQLAETLTSEGFSVQTGVPYGGSVAQWILEESDVRHVDLILMATHGRVGLDRLIHGSVAEGVVHNATAPVMLVRSDANGDSAKRLAALEPVLIVPLDGSHLAEAALPMVTELRVALSAKVVLVGVVPKPGQLVAGEYGAIVTYVGDEHQALEASAAAYLEASVGPAGASETFVRYGDAATEIAGVAEQYPAAIVVMATHGRTGFARSVLGSVAGGVLHHTQCPVVLVHPGGLRPAEQPLQAAAAV